MTLDDLRRLASVPSPDATGAIAKLLALVMALPRCDACLSMYGRHTPATRGCADAHGRLVGKLRRPRWSPA